MSRELLEQETTITYNRAEDHAYLWTANKHDANAWMKLGIVLQPWGDGWRGQCPREWVRIRKPKQYSEEGRAKAAERMRRLHEAKNG